MCLRIYLIQISIAAGKTAANKNPDRKPEDPKRNTAGSFAALSAISPTIHGPVAAPKSPEAASTANIEVPASGKRSAARTRLPGHNRLTPNPLSAHAASDSAGTSENTTTT